MKRILLVLGLGLFAYGLYTLWGTIDGRNRHDEAIALMVATQPYRAEVLKALRAGAPMPAPAAVPRQARAMAARTDGTIVIEVNDDLAPGGRFTLRPERDPGGEYQWTCVPERVRFVPVECRSQAKP